MHSTSNVERLYRASREDSSALMRETGKRVNRTFVEAEVALGLQSFAMWGAVARILFAAGRQEEAIKHLKNAAGSAGQIAGTFCFHVLGDDSCFPHVRKAFPNFDPRRELDLGARCIGPDDRDWGFWSSSLTSSVVLTTRVLLSVAGQFDSLKIGATNPGELILASAVWTADCLDTVTSLSIISRTLEVLEYDYAPAFVRPSLGIVYERLSELGSVLDR